jgi:uncharacterized membrane protein YbhN (UPF0104 family)
MRILRNSKVTQAGKALVTCVLLYLLLRAVAWDSLIVALGQAQLRWFLFACAAAVATLVLSAWRWQFLLKSLDVPSPPLPSLVYYYVVSGFFNNLAPANLAGDAMRANSLFQRGCDGVAAASSVVLERLLNMAGLGALGIWVLATQPLPLSLHVEAKLVWAATIILAVVIVTVYSLWSYLPARLREQVTRLRAVLASAGMHPYALGQSCLVTVGLLFVTMLIMFGSLQAVSVSLPLSTQFAVYAIAGLALTIPVTIQGVGVREGVYVGLLGLVGVDSPRVLAALALNYIIVVLLSVVGGVLFWWRPRYMRSPLIR